MEIFVFTKTDTLGGLTGKCLYINIKLKLLTNIITGGWCQSNTNTNESFISERNSEEFLIIAAEENKNSSISMTEK